MLPHISAPKLLNKNQPFVNLLLLMHSLGRASDEIRSWMANKLQIIILIVIVLSCDRLIQKP